MIEDYGILSLFPTALVLVLAVVTKKAVMPLIVGAVVAFVMLDGIFFPSGLISATYTVFKGDTLPMIVMVTFLFGALIQLFERSHAAHAFSASVNRHVKSSKQSLFAAWFMGLALFIDDFLNAIVVGTTMRRTTDRYGVPREMLAYITDVTAAPMAVMLPFSAWAVFFMSLFVELGLTDFTGMSEFDMYWHVIPFIFYAIVAIGIVPLVITGIIPALGQMKDAYKKVPSTVAAESADEPSSAAGKAKAYHFLVPILILVVVTFATNGDVTQGALISLIVTAVVFWAQKIMSKEEIAKAMQAGIVSMLPVTGIIFFSLLLVEGNAQLGTAEFVVATIAPFMSAEMIPFATFCVVSALAFSTGSFFGTAAVVMPIIVPLVLSTGCNVFLAMGATISGAVFGSHCCFFGDATVLTASSCQITPIRHALTQLPYGIISWAIASVLYIALGFVL